MRDADGQEGVHLLHGHGLLIEERADDAADAADIHDAGDAQVQVAGFLRQDLAGAAVEQRDALHDGPGDEGYQIKHRLRLLSAGLPDADLIVDEELTADDEEEDDAGEDIREGVVQAEDAGDLAGAPVSGPREEDS